MKARRREGLAGRGKGDGGRASVCIEAAIESAARRAISPRAIEGFPEKTPRKLICRGRVRIKSTR